MAELGGVPLLDPGLISNLPNSYWAGLEEAYKQRNQNAFKNGVPTLPDGSPDYAAISKTALQAGGIPGAKPAIDFANLDLARQQLALGQQTSQGIGAMEAGGVPPLNVPTIGRAMGPPSTASATPSVGPPTSAGALSGASVQGDNGVNTIASVVGRHYSPEMAGPIINNFADRLKIDPNAPIRDQGVLQRLDAATQRMAQARAGGMPTAGTAGGNTPGPYPPQTPDRAALPTGPDPEIQRQIARYTQIIANPAIPQPTRDAAKLRLEALQKTVDTTGVQKEYDLARRQGFAGSLQQFEQQREADKAYAGESEKSFVKKYQAIDEAGVKAITELPQLEVAKRLLLDPRFYSGPGEHLNETVKRFIAATGFGDPNTAFPQEVVKKTLSGNLLQSLGQLKGLGQIRVAEINIAQRATASTENTPTALRALVEISSRLHQRAAALAEMAQGYRGGRIDAGFDRAAADYVKNNPLFSSEELKNPKLLGLPLFKSPADIPRGLPKGTPFRTPDNRVKEIP